MSNLEKHPKHYHYPLKQAQKDTERWRKTQRVHAFAIDRQELADIISEAPDEVDTIRVYFGMTEDGNEKMFLVAAKKEIMTTEEDGEEVIIIRDLIDEDAAVAHSDGTVEYFVYDFTNPCPPTCDDTSPLMN
ncbi:MAG: hypothetical protein V4585_12165 [Bacteroidota bacterium]|jgi:hypothetical protein